MDLKQNIIVSGGDQAAAEVAKLSAANQAVAGATKAHGTEAEKTTGVLEQLGHRTGGAREAIEGFERATQGGTAGVLGMAKGLLALRESLAINPLSFFAGAALALIPTVIELGRKLFETGEEAKDASKGLSEAADAGQRLGEVKFDALKAELDGITSRKSALDEFSAKLDEIAKKTANAQKAAILAEIDASDLDPEAKKKEKYLVEQRFAKVDAARDDQSRAERVAAAQRVVEETAAAQAAAEAARDRKQQQIEKENASAQEYRDLESQLSRTPRTFSRPDPNRERGTITEKNPAYDDLERRIAAHPGGGLTGEMQSYESGFLGKLTEAAKKAEEAARKAREELERLRSITSLEDANAPIIRGLEDRTRRINSGIPEPAIRDDGRSRNSMDAAPSLRINGVDRSDLMNGGGHAVTAGIDAAFKRLGDTVVQAIQFSAAQTEEKIKAARR